MKSATFLFLFLTITTTSFSQIKKGQFLIGGNISFESAKNENAINSTYTSNNFFISPAIGYFIAYQLAGGLRIDLSLYNSKSDNVDTHYTATTISPFLRYYLLPVPGKVNVFIDVSYLHTKTKSSLGYSEKAKGYYLSAGPSVFLTKQIALEFTLGYKHTDSDNFGHTKVDIFNSGFGLQIHLGKLQKKLAAARMPAMGQ